MEATAVMTTEPVDIPVTVKRRKLGSSLPFVQIKTIDCESYINSLTEVEPSPRLSGSPEKLKVSDPLDLEENVETGPAVTGRYDTGEDESTLGSEVNEGLGEPECSVVKNIFRRAMLSPEKVPPEAELEEFFAAAHAGLNKRFKDKYNFDTVDGIPLKGRFEWIQLMPRK